MKTFEINGVTYKPASVDFNFICELEELGLSLGEVANKPLSLIRAYLSLCGGISAEEAGRQINEHIKTGGKLDDIMTALSDAIEASDFFQKQTK